MRIFHLFIAAFVILSHSVFFGQGIGLVLSGGGASGFAHIGVIKALEENGIPIQSISGTSAGALIGSMYACGYSPSEIEAYALSNKFQLMSNGELEASQNFLLREDESNASVINFSFSKDSIFQKSLPTNFIRPELLDFEMMRIFGPPSANANNNFDSLFIPFRCVASDIVAKKAVTFRDGFLNEAVRASMTFPFYVNPIRIKGVLYFDGGLYNNFPADVMYNELSPDFIIGSNVSYNADPPREDDLISQLTNMLVSYTNFDLPCEDGLIITPKTTLQTFDFEHVEEAIREGYFSTLAKMDSIKMYVKERVNQEELNLKRAAYRSSIPPLIINEVRTTNKFGEDESYVRKSILKNNKGLSIGQRKLERRYFRTYATPQIQYLFPTLSQKLDSSFVLDLDVSAAKDFRIDIGGLICSRAVNTGFIQANYLRLGRTATALQLNSYFGKFYGSGKAALDIHFPSYYPVSFTGYFVLNRFDYFRSFATFFEDVQPSFLVQYETFAGAQIKLPLFNNSKSVFDYKHVQLEDRYYQTPDFDNKDTTDETRFGGDVIGWSIEQNSLNRKQFASSGTYFSLKSRLVFGQEHSISGSTSLDKYDYRKQHQWGNITAELRSYLISTKPFSFGIHGIANITSQSLFKNYTATILSLNSFQPIPDMATYFLPEYRSPQFVGGGVNIIFSISKTLDIRFDGYLYQPFKQLVINDDNTFGYSKLFKGDSQVAAISGIYHSPLGPVRISFNYFPKQITPINFQISYGYVLFNERATR